MKKKIIGIFVCMLLIAIVLPVSGNVDVESTSMLLSSGNTLYVGGSGTGNYTKIQDAIDNASNGDTVFVYDDSSPYYENVVVGKSITLIGEGRETTIIDGGGSSDVILINDYIQGVTISGFTIRNSGDEMWEDAGIEIRSSFNIIKGNIITNNNYYGILNFLEDDWTVYNIIFENIITNNKYGIALVDSFHNTVYKNRLANNTVGVLVSPSQFPLITSTCDYHLYDWDNSIYGNTITNNRCGIMIDHYSRVNVFENNITNNEKGISVEGTHGWGSRNNIYQNNIANNEDGIVLKAWWSSGACNNNIYLNNLRNNEKGIYIISEWEGNCPNGNKIYQNNFIENGISALICTQKIFLGRNNWTGNYWNRLRLLPYIIFGRAGPYGFIPRFQFDWHPAQEPYDI